MQRERGRGRVFLKPGRSVWMMAYYHDKKLVRETTGAREKADAIKALTRRLKERDGAEVGGPALIVPETKRISVADLLDALLQDFKMRGKASPQNANGIKRAREEFGHISAVDFGSKHVNRFIENKLAEGRKNAGINRMLETVKQAFALAVREERLPKVPYIKRLSERENVRQGFVTKPEFERVREQLPEDLQDVAAFAFACGWRRGEVCNLDWSNVADDNSVIRLRPEQSKNRHGRVVPVKGELAPIIARRRAARAVTSNGTTTLSRYVFHRDGERVGDFRKAWANACKAAGKSGLLFHDLRRSAVSALVASGVPMQIAMTISGHKTPSMFTRYNITSVAEQVAALEAVERFHARKVAEAEGQASNVVPIAAQR